MQMSDGQNNGPGGRKPLTLNRSVGAGTVKQSFSHGRSKQVVVEVKKKREGAAPAPATSAPGPGSGSAAGPRPSFVPTAPTTRPAGAAPQAPRPSGPSPSSGEQRQRPTGTLGLSEREIAARQAALDRARQMEDERRERDRLEAEARSRREEAERRRFEDERRREQEEAERRPPPRTSRPESPRPLPRRRQVQPVMMAQVRPRAKKAAICWPSLADA
jgi:translation initiation factor IF-2